MKEKKDTAKIVSRVVQEMCGVGEGLWPDMERTAKLWLAGGFDPVTEIYPTVRNVMARRDGVPPEGAAYFTVCLDNEREHQAKIDPDNYTIIFAGAPAFNAWVKGPGDNQSFYESMSRITVPIEWLTEFQTQQHGSTKWEN